MPHPTDQLDAPATVPGPAAGTVTDLVADLAHLGAEDVDRAGGKGANLGEMVRAGFPVPGGFVVLAESFRTAIAATRAEVAALNEAALDAARARASGATEDVLAVACRRLQDAVRSARMPAPVADDVRTAYDRLGPATPVAVRSSAVGEDSSDTSYAGMNATFTNVSGADGLLTAVVECWASAFTPRVLAYRAEHGKDDLPDIAVVVQRMAPAEKAGVAFTADPVSGRRDRVVVEAAWGQGEVVVSGRTEPDTYVLDAAGPRLLEAHRGAQTQKIVAAPGGGDRVLPIDAAESGPVLSQEEAERDRHPGAAGAGPLRRAAGHRVGAHRRRAVPGPDPADHDPVRRCGPRGRGDRPGHRAPEGSGRLPGPRHRPGAGAALPRRGRPDARRRGPGGPADQPRLDARGPAGRRPGHRHRRHHLPRGDRRPGARRPGGRRHPERHAHPGRRRRGDRRRGDRPGPRRSPGRPRVRPGAARRGRGAGVDARRSWARPSTSISPTPPRRSMSRRWPSTGWACCGPSCS